MLNVLHIRGIKMKAKAQKIGDGVYWIGVLDWDLRSYHGYTLDGTTYNAYIVFGEKVAIIDNAYPGKTEEMMARIEDAFEQEGREVKVDYIHCSKPRRKRPQWCFIRLMEKIRCTNLLQ